MPKKIFRAEICVFKDGRIYLKTYWRNVLCYRSYIKCDDDRTRGEGFVNKCVSHMVNQFPPETWKIKVYAKPRKKWFEDFDKNFWYMPDYNK